MDERVIRTVRITQPDLSLLIVIQPRHLLRYASPGDVPQIFFWVMGFDVDGAYVGEMTANAIGTKGVNLDVDDITNHFLAALRVKIVPVDPATIINPAATQASKRPTTKPATRPIMIDE